MPTVRCTEAPGESRTSTPLRVTARSRRHRAASPAMRWWICRAPELPTSATIFPAGMSGRRGAGSWFRPGIQLRNLFQRGERNLVCGRIGEGHVVEPHRDAVADPGDVHGIRSILDQRFEVEDLEDPLETHQRTHDLDAGVGQRGQRCVHPGQQQRQRHHRAGRKVVVHSQPAAQAVHQRQRQRRDQHQCAEEVGLQHGRRIRCRAPHPRGPRTLRIRGRDGRTASPGWRRVRRTVRSSASTSVRCTRHSPVPGRPCARPSVGGQHEHRQQDQRQQGDLPTDRQHHPECQDEGHEVGNHPERVSLNARCAPITSLFRRLTRAPVRVRVKNATGIRCT